jgi:hypothetical protein
VALFKPVTMMSTSLASKTVRTPTVSAILGTKDKSPLKNRLPLQNECARARGEIWRDGEHSQLSLARLG